MSLMISELYDALVAAGCPEDKARRAAVAMAGIQQRNDLQREIRRGDWRWGILIPLALVTSFAAGFLGTWLIWLALGVHH